MGSLEKRDGKFFQEFLSDDHVEVGLRGTATKAQVVAFVDSPRCEVKSYSIDSFQLTMFDSQYGVAYLSRRANTQRVTARPCRVQCGQARSTLGAVTGG